MSKANWLGCIFAMIQQMTEIKRLGAFFGVKKGEGWGRNLFDTADFLKKENSSQGTLQKRNHCVYSTWEPSVMARLVNALWPESFSPPLHFGGVPWTRGLWHIVGYHIHLGRWSSRFGMRLRNVVFTRVPNDSTFPVANLQLSGKYWRSGFTSNGSFSFFFLTPHPLGSFSLWRWWWWWLFTLLSFLPQNYIIMYIFSLECFYIFEVELLVSSEIYSIVPLIWHEGSYNFFQWI